MTSPLNNSNRIIKIQDETNIQDRYILNHKTKVTDIFWGTLCICTGSFIMGITAIYHFQYPCLEGCDTYTLSYGIGASLIGAGSSIIIFSDKIKTDTDHD